MAMRPEKIAAIQNKMQQLEIFESDIIEKFILGSGRGGQKINKTNSCVYLKHTPSQAEIRCQASRSRELNRWLARRALCQEIESRLSGKLPKRLTVVKIKRR